MHQNSVEGVDDMIDLHDVHEAGIIRNLRVRFVRDEIYTYTGTILVAMNPNKRMSIYGMDHVRKYRDAKLRDHPPHIYATANVAHSKMVKSQSNQCIITSGESGAGKTESTKLILQFLAAQSGQHSWIEQQILDANPILEAFGNSKTVRNYNSSRFGKYIDIHFDEFGAIQGARIEQYLLEKSRVVSQNENELNYHIFYCMLAGLREEDLTALRLVRQVEEYVYLTEGSCPPLASLHTQEEWQGICRAMKVLMFKEDEMESIMKLLAAILHIGNLRFRALEIRGLDASEIISHDTCTVAASLLEVDEAGLKQWFTYRSTSAHKDTSVSPLSMKQAEDVRDAFAKGLYSRLFQWITDKINWSIYRPEKLRLKSDKRLSLGVLDIFGFENSDLGNYFEQMCVNYTNEKLHQFFLRHIFALEQSEYETEKINWSRIQFVDNQIVLDLLAMRPMNILALVDEESRFPKGSDTSLLEKLSKTHGQHSYFICPRPNSSKFGIQHFAGPVTYDSTGFLEKNRDTFSKDLIRLLNLSQSRFLQKLFEEDLRGMTLKKPPTLATQFKQSLAELMTILSSCEPFFVRCIKPNILQKPMLFDRKLCLQQLRYSGMMETVKIRILGYPIRLPFRHFIDRYRILLPDLVAKSQGTDSYTLACKMGRVLLGDKDWQAGRTKMFIKETENVMLERARALIIETSAVKIQKAVRFWIFKRYLARVRAAIIVLQRKWRSLLTRKRYIKMKIGFRRLQAIVRQRRQRKRYLSIRRKLIAVQSRSRGFLVRREINMRHEAAIRIQCLVRQCLARKTYHRLCAEAGIERERLLREQRLKREQEEREAAERARRELELLAEQAAVEERRKKEAEEKELQKREDEKRQREEEERAVRQREEEEEKALKEETNRQRVAERNYSTAFIGEEKAFGFATPQLQKRVVDALLAGSSTLFSPLPGALEASLNLSPVEGLTLDVNETEDETEELEVAVKPSKEEEKMKYKFSKFMATYFQHPSTCNGFVRKPPPRSLLYIRDETQKKAASHLYVCIMQLMGDRPESKRRPQQETEAATILGQIRFHQLRGTQFLLPAYQLSQLDKLHYIVGYGILYPTLRDEIYSIICKQLINNSNPSSKALGWIIMCLCLGCFLPSSRLSPYLVNFIRSGPRGYAPFCEERMKRTQEKGNRYWPPSFVELQAAKSGELCKVPVSLMDGHVKSVLIDPATTAGELCKLIADKLNLNDTFGFSIYCSAFGKVYNLGCTHYHIMDAISPCEQFARLQEAGSIETQLQRHPWKLLLCKEIFVPWHDTATDPVATDLIYHQVIRGLKSGEYPCENQEELAGILAYQYYIQHGTGLTTKRLHGSIDDFLPTTALNEMPVKKWAGMVKTKHSKATYVHKKIPSADVKKELVAFARSRWRLKFSRIYPVQEQSGPASQSRENIRLAINADGVSLVRQDQSVIVECAYQEIVRVERSHKGTPRNEFVVVSLSKGEWQFRSPQASEICQLVNNFLDGLSDRSRYGIALRDTIESERALKVTKGDLIILEKPFLDVQSQRWLRCSCARTREQGEFPIDSIYVLATVDKPDKQTTALFAKLPSETAQNLLLEAQRKTSSGGFQRKVTRKMGQQEVSKPITVAMLHTLEEFSREHFYIEIHKKTKSKASKMMRPVWMYSKEPIKTPLMKSLVKKDGRPTEVGLKAVEMFLVILQFCGDYPTRKAAEGTELTDDLFLSPIKYEELHDETYCQLVKQLTHNENKNSETRAWELMWLCTGLFPCSKTLWQEIGIFFLSHVQHSPVARECQRRLNATVKSGESRQYPPHLVEVLAIQIGNTRCYHKISFPNGSQKTAFTGSRTKVREMVKCITSDLKVQQPQCFDVVMQLGDDAHAIPGNPFLLDYLRQFAAEQEGKVEGSVDSAYQLVMVKKLWFSTRIGKEPLVDQLFHFHQELPKYLQGYHKCSITQCPKIAALLYLINYGRSMTVFSAFETALTQLVPTTFIAQMKIIDWKKHIREEFGKLPATMTKAQAQTEFLRSIAQFRTFGSAFFPVQQSLLRQMPSLVIVAINAKGVHLLAPDTKDLLKSIPYPDIMNWSSGNNYFHFSTGDMTRSGAGFQFLCETTLGPKMDDLISNYVTVQKNTGHDTKRGRKSNQKQEQSTWTN
ncbi:unconventional myosin-VIIa-like isoform X2 [Corticium candelabrum]|nr:unconventional myosin-VIIa-like isoform X2 [Corticium candelabrum]